MQASLFLYFCGKLKKMFLPFGTIAPGLLLSLLGFAYMMFFGSYALSKATGNEEPEKPGTRIFEESSRVSLPASSTFYYPSDDDSHDNLITNNEAFDGKEPAITVTIKIPDEDKTPDTHPFSHFARPPPFTTVA